MTLIKGQSLDLKQNMKAEECDLDIKFGIY